MLRHGEVFAGYVIERELGRGGMGSVYAARHPRLPRLIALKLLHRDMFGDHETRLRFEREADVVAQLDHPNIITVFDRGAEGDQLWIAMQYVDGTDCASLDPRELAPERAADIMVQTAAALDHAHGRGILHRDVKPANILLSHSAGPGSGFSERVLLSDFGIARVLDGTAGLTRTGTLNATLAFASPEQLTAAELDHRSDQYSLACTLFRLLTGRGPFDAGNLTAVMLGHIQSPVPAVSEHRGDLPPALDTVLARAMSKDREDRFASCSEFAWAAREAVAGAGYPSGSGYASAPGFPGAGSTRGYTTPGFGNGPVSTPGYPHGHSSTPGFATDPLPTPGYTHAPASASFTPPSSAPAPATMVAPVGRAPESAARDSDSHAPGAGSLPASGAGSPRRTDVPEGSSIEVETVHGCLLGGAVGDALGAPVESMLLRNIQQRYGIRGVTGERGSYQGAISDETQLTLFTTEALIRSSVRARARGIGGATLGMIQENLLIWLTGQGTAIAEQPFELRSSLTAYPELMRFRGTSSATASVMRRVGEQRKPRALLGTRGNPVNDSKGCAAVVRSAPCGFSESLDRAFELACDAAALTHGNPGGWLPAGTFAAIVYGLSHGLDLRAAVDAARTELVRHREHEETAQALDAAVRLVGDYARLGRPMPEPEVLQQLGDGVIGPEALAIAVFCALCAETIGGTPEQIFRNGVLLSVNHSGDSDSTAAICGALLGTRLGVHAVPEDWRTGLDAAAVVERLATDFCKEFGPTPPADKFGAPTANWQARYPG
ncbi:ADP-ribosylglycohydrolase family protein [Nocardia huaxiensis]|uniref:ADP-ribosylglycohydrolase family protein n=1 Tax=Nocardia huaxiensis TaxID=2755382 RepID=UPI001E558C6B|nr:ADP-ribosylglycohydrolase family protein [Nocardia huaxiensis]UFS96366.1 ADP-ribosylglycohydrolase family protein [Nocardia huaxiensis]